MEFQVRVEELTQEQEEREARAYEAAKILRREGFKVEVRKLFSPNPNDCPAGIYID